MYVCATELSTRLAEWLSSIFACVQPELVSVTCHLRHSETMGFPADLLGTMQPFEKAAWD